MRGRGRGLGAAHRAGLALPTAVLLEAVRAVTDGQAATVADLKRLAVVVVAARLAGVDAALVAAEVVGPLHGLGLGDGRS